MNAEEIKRRAEQAEWVIKSEPFIDAMETVRREIYDGWISASQSDREDMRKMELVRRRFLEILTGYMRAGVTVTNARVE